MPTLIATAASFSASSVSGHTFTAGASSGGIPPSAPDGLTANPAVAKITLNWNPSTGATSYSVFRGTIPAGESGTALATGITGTTYADTSLPAATTYYYQVKAVNGSGTSASSNEATTTTTAQRITAIVSPAIKPGDTNKTVTLTDNGYAAWTSGTPGSPTFTVAKAPTNDVTKNSQAVVSATSATVNVDAGATSGTLTFDAGGGLTAILQVSNTQVFKSPISISIKLGF